MKKLLITKMTKLAVLFLIIYGSIYWVILPISYTSYNDKYQQTDTDAFDSVAVNTTNDIKRGVPLVTRKSMYSRLTELSVGSKPEVDTPRWTTNVKQDNACEQQTSEMQCMQCALYWEARSEPSDDQFLVGLTILNRVRSKQYPNTICGVVWEKHQFTFTEDGKSDTMKDTKAIKQTNKMATEILHHDDYGTGNFDVETSPTAMYYHDTSIDPPYWTNHMKAYARTKSFIFYEK